MTPASEQIGVTRNLEACGFRTRQRRVPSSTRGGPIAPHRRLRAYATSLIRKSSIRLPDFNFAASQRGVLPRPAQVSDGRSGLRNFGTTVGYGRRPPDDFVRSASIPPLSCFKRSSSRRFSASREAASLAATSSWSAHNSSVDIDLRSMRFMTVPNHDSTVAIVGTKHEQNKANLEPLSGRKVPAAWRASNNATITESTWGCTTISILAHTTID